jgi:hypothetical protein
MSKKCKPSLTKLRKLRPRPIGSALPTRHLQRLLCKPCLPAVACGPDALRTGWPEGRLPISITIISKQILHCKGVVIDAAGHKWACHKSGKSEQIAAFVKRL